MAPDFGATITEWTKQKPHVSPTLIPCISLLLLLCTFRILSMIDIKMIKEKSKPNDVFLGFCQWNKCNNKNTTQLFIDAIKHNYDLSEMFRVLNINLDDDGNITFITTTTITSTVTTTTISTTSMAMTTTSSNHLLQS